jgi:hypothetical protein
MSPFMVVYSRWMLSGSLGSLRHGAPPAQNLGSRPTVSHLPSAPKLPDLRQHCARPNDPPRVLHPFAGFNLNHLVWVDQLSGNVKLPACPPLQIADHAEEISSVPYHNNDHYINN